MSRLTLANTVAAGLAVSSRSACGRDSLTPGTKRWAVPPREETRIEGQAIPNLAGTKFPADCYAGFARSFRFVNGQVTEHGDWIALRSAGHIASFGEDAAGEP